MGLMGRFAGDATLQEKGCLGACGHFLPPRHPSEGGEGLRLMREAYRRVCLSSVWRRLHQGEQPHPVPALSQPPPLAAPPLISGCRVCCLRAWRGLPGAALGQLADSPANQQAIAAAGGVEAVLGAMRAHPEAQTVQRYCCRGA